MDWNSKLGKWFCSWMILCLVGLSACACGSEDKKPVNMKQGPPKNSVKLEMGGKEVTLEVAATEAARALGLMKRKTMTKDHGMIFIYREPQIMSFYMRNTWIPLSIAFLKSDGTVVNIEEMRPNTESPSHMSKGYCRYAIEMNKGWFAEHGIKAGDKIALTPRILAIEPE